MTKSTEDVLVAQQHLTFAAFYVVFSFNLHVNYLATVIDDLNGVYIALC